MQRKPLTKFNIIYDKNSPESIIRTRSQMHGAVHSFTARVATMTPRRDQAGVRSQPRRGQGRQKDRR